MSTYQIGDEPYRHYWRVLYPKYADPAQAHWLAKFKTLLMSMGLFGERQQARHEWIATGPRRGREESHVTAVVTHHASPVRSLTLEPHSPYNRGLMRMRVKTLRRGIPMN
jgi:hypothetical protein